MNRKHLRHALEALRELAKKRCDRKNCGTVCLCGSCHARAALPALESAWNNFELTRETVEKGAKGTGRAHNLVLKNLEQKRPITRRDAIALIEVAYAQGYAAGAHE